MARIFRCCSYQRLILRVAVLTLVALSIRWLRRTAVCLGLAGPAAAVEFPAEVEVFAVGLFQSGFEGLSFLAMPLLELVDLCGEREYEGVALVGLGRVGRCWPGLCA